MGKNLGWGDRAKQIVPGAIPTASSPPHLAPKQPYAAQILLTAQRVQSYRAQWRQRTRFFFVLVFFLFFFWRGGRDEGI